MTPQLTTRSSKTRMLWAHDLASSRVISIGHFCDGANGLNSCRKASRLQIRRVSSLFNHEHLNCLPNLVQVVHALNFFRPLQSSTVGRLSLLTFLLWGLGVLTEVDEGSDDGDYQHGYQQKR